MQLEQIHARIVRNPDTECWDWTGPFSGNGYGRVTYDGRPWRVHRLVYTLIKGEIPSGLQLDHLCRNRACCNPAHLEPVTGKVNVRRSPIHNYAKTHCKQGHPFTRENTGINRSAGHERRFCRTCQRAWNRAAAAKRRARSQDVAA